MLKILIALFSIGLYQQQARAAENILDAEAAIKAGAPLSAYSQYAGHPLYPYLQYRAYKNNLAAVPTEELVNFLKNNPRAPYSGWLAESAYPMWLAQGSTKAILASYSPAFADESIECEWRLANLQTGSRGRAEANIKDLWLSAKSIEPACTPLFQQMISDGSLSQQLIAERFRLVMQQGSLSLALSLRPLLTGTAAEGANQWLAIRQNRLPMDEALRISDAAMRSAALADIIYRNAKSNREAAVSLALTAARNNAFTHHPEAAGRALSRLTALLAQDNDPRCEQTYLAIPKGQHDKNAVFDLIAYELRLNRRAQLADLLSQHLSHEEIDKIPEYAYWIAKSLEQTGHASQAKHWYTKAAGRRDLFGFYAAEKLGQKPAMNDRPLRKDPAIYNRILQQPEAYRMQSFLRLGDTARAAQEYKALTYKMNPAELRQAALFAAENGWPVMAITTLVKSGDWDALAIRFPTQYQPQVRQFAQAHGINPATVFAIIRKESIFQPAIRSNAGAIGLMQVMPATARHTANQYGIPYAGAASLTDPNTNLQIGSQYLADRLQQFGHLGYAAAAYNAGPSRVSRWQEANSSLPMDEWLAQIPFYETRDYAKRVLEYERIYEYRLGLQHQHNRAVREY